MTFTSIHVLEEEYRSNIDYIVGNKKLRSLVPKLKVHMEYDINSDHFLVVADTILLTRWRRQKFKQRDVNEVFIVYLSNDESIKFLYQLLLQQRLHRTAMDED